MWRKAAIYGDGEVEAMGVVGGLTCRCSAISNDGGGEAALCFATATNLAGNVGAPQAQVTRWRNHAEARSITVTTTTTMIRTAAVCA
jgi:hypothetical protein